MNERNEASTPWADEIGDREFTHLLVNLSLRLCSLVVEIEESTRYDGRFMANIHALRLLKESQAGGAYLLPRCEVEFWKESYFRWLDRVKRLPKGLDRAQLHQAANDEFARLQNCAVNFNRGVWLSNISLGFSGKNETETARKFATIVYLRQDWSPCQIVAFQNQQGETEYSLTFSQFELAKASFTKHKIENNGFVWTDLMDHLTPTSVRQFLQFHPESSLVSVSSSMVAVLHGVRSSIFQLIEDPEIFDQAANKKTERGSPTIHYARERRNDASSSPANRTVTLPIPEIRQGDWSPCRLVPYTNEQGQQEYSVIFNQFERAEEAFAERGLENDGYGWTDILRAFADKRTLKTLDFDPESSMVSVLSSKIESLKKVRGWITQLLEDPKSLDKAIKRMK
ncbi:MAG: Imm51 family immunity protein [Pirellulaceae bacterium]